MDGFELALEISTPDVVGSQDLGGGFARIGDDAATPFVGDQTLAAQDFADSPSMRPMPAWVFLAEDFQQFLSSPAGMVAASLQDRRNPPHRRFDGATDEVFVRVPPGRWGHAAGNAGPIYSPFFG